MRCTVETIGTSWAASGGANWPDPDSSIERAAPRKATRCSGATSSTSAKRSAMARDGRRRAPSIARIISAEQPACSASTSCVQSCAVRRCLSQRPKLSGASIAVSREQVAGCTGMCTGTCTACACAHLRSIAIIALHVTPYNRCMHQKEDLWLYPREAQQPRWFVRQIWDAAAPYAV